MKSLQAVTLIVVLLMGGCVAASARQRTTVRDVVTTAPVEVRTGTTELAAVNARLDDIEANMTLTGVAVEDLQSNVNARLTGIEAHQTIYGITGWQAVGGLVVFGWVFTKAFDAVRERRRQRYYHAVRTKTDKP